MKGKSVYLYGEPVWSRGFHVVPNVYPVRCAGSGSQLLVILYTTPHFGGRTLGCADLFPTFLS